MRTPLLSARLAHAGIAVAISPATMTRQLSLETWTKIVYIPITISRAAFEYADFVCRICAEKRLDFKKQTRIIKEQMKEYERETVGQTGEDIKKDLEECVDGFFEEADGYINQLQCSVQDEMKKQWPELKDYSLLLNIYMCVILIDVVGRFEQAASKVIAQATASPYSTKNNNQLLYIRRECLSIAGKYKLPNTEMIRMGVTELAINIEKMVKVVNEK